ncbi:hypothetical protein PV11_00258 [Exophiala sideris]|uniref:Phenazine biosynthesis-like protein n=2 Tax=Exophiala sideris TaxID=1016849 RepID=A0A0D1ZCL0_9EURO|nr:hypothetical protein PV11_00258 [Exophiala sideris]
MASGPHTFVTMVVFSPEKFQGNPLAIVAIRGNAISQKRKGLIAKEFGYSETVFLHDAPAPGMPRLCEIFTETGEEIPFGGHPIIGAAHYIFSYCEKMHYGGPADRDTQRQTGVLLTKAGKIPIFFNPYRQVAACSVPHNFHVHQHQVPMDKIIATQPQIQIVPGIDKAKSRSFPVVSIVKGMTFILVDLTDHPDILAAVQPGKAPEAELDSEWSPSFVGCFYYKILNQAEKPGEPTIHNIQVRMISHGIEDAASGSACCALSCYLAMQSSSKSSNPESSEAGTELAKQTEGLKLEEKTERKVFGIQQGVEMGRLSTIAVEVDVKTDAQGKVSLANVILSGRANMHTRGELVGA